MTPPDSGKDNVVRAITKDTQVTLWAAVVCVIGLFTAYIKADARLRVMENQLISLQMEVSNLSRLFEQAASDRWTQTEMYYWHLIFKEKNPDVEVPPVPTPATIH